MIFQKEKKQRTKQEKKKEKKDMAEAKPPYMIRDSDIQKRACFSPLL